MLQFISIDSFALIDHLEIEFQPGLNLITGETGSGKSILVDAVGLLVGSRAHQEVIRQGSNQARIEGCFRLRPENPALALLVHAGIRPPNGELVIRREITRSGSNRVFVNQQLSTLGFLLQLGRFLVDIHGQHTQQSLLNPQSHLDYLDRFGKNNELRDSFLKAYQRLLQTQSKLRALQQSEHERLQRIDLLRFQSSEIDSLRLTPGLDIELEKERDLLASAEQRTRLAGEAHERLYEREDAITSSLKQVEDRLDRLAQLDPTVEGIRRQVGELRFTLEDIAFQVRDYSNSIEFDPLHLEQIEERTAEIDKARRKYGSTVDEILEFRKRIGKELENLDQSEQTAEDLKSSLDELSHLAMDKAKMLSLKRVEDSQTLRRIVERELSELSIKDACFMVLLSSLNELTEKGIDAAEFLFSANPGEEPRPLAKIASGGELSRIMLALKSALKSDHYPSTLVFDEVDSGIGGKAATVLGEKLSRLAQTHQVFCVTHLPQIAGFADQHFHVDKFQQSGRTLVSIRLLDEKGRIEELSRMLAGEAVTETTRQQARQMLARTRG